MVRKIFLEIQSHQGFTPINCVIRVSTEGIIFQIGVIPRRIDIITKVDGVTYEEADEDKIIIDIEDLKIGNTMPDLAGIPPCRISDRHSYEASREQTRLFHDID